MIQAGLQSTHIVNQIMHIMSVFLLGGILSACKLHGDVLIAGYANGKTCLWNVESNWHHSLQASAEVHQNPSETNVECVAVLDNICSSAFGSG